MSIKKKVRKQISKNAFLTLLVSRLYALLLSINAFRYRFFPAFLYFVSWQVKVTGWKNVFIGKNVVVSAGSWLNVNQRSVEGKSLVIDDNSFIGRNNFFTVGNSIYIGKYCLTASDCAFIGSSHNVGDPFLPYISTGTDVKNSIYVGANCFFGYRATVIGNVRVGHGSIIGACAMVREDVPPFSMVVGVPARVVKHYSFERSEWVNGARQDGVYPNEEEYVAMLKKNSGFVIQPISVAATFFGDI